MLYLLSLIVFEIFAAKRRLILTFDSYIRSKTRQICQAGYQINYSKFNGLFNAVKIYTGCSTLKSIIFYFRCFLVNPCYFALGNNE